MTTKVSPAARSVIPVSSAFEPWEKDSDEPAMVGPVAATRAPKAVIMVAMRCILGVVVESVILCLLGCMMMKRCGFREEQRRARFLLMRRSTGHVYSVTTRPLRLHVKCDFCSREGKRLRQQHRTWQVRLGSLSRRDLEPGHLSLINRDTLQARAILAALRSKCSFFGASSVAC